MYHTVQSAAEILIYISNIVNIQYCVVQCTEQKLGASLYLQGTMYDKSLDVTRYIQKGFERSRWFMGSSISKYAELLLLRAYLCKII